MTNEILRLLNRKTSRSVLFDDILETLFPQSDQPSTSAFTREIESDHLGIAFDSSSDFSSLLNPELSHLFPFPYLTSSEKACQKR